MLANVVNNGASSGSYNVALKINGKVEQQRTIEVSPGTAYPVRFTVTKSKLGKYSVDINGQRGSFTILGVGSRQGGGAIEGLLLAVATGVIVILLGLVIIIARRRL